MTTENKIRIGIIGAGNIGNVHANEFSKLGEECVITAITDLDLNRAEASAKKYGIENAPPPKIKTNNREVDVLLEKRRFL